MFLPYFRFRIEAVLKEEIVREQLPLAEYYAINIRDKNKIASSLQILPHVPPEANHLKRIRNGQVLIQSANEPLSVVLMFAYT